MREDDVLVIIFFVCIPVSFHESSDVALNHSSSCTKMINRYWGGWQYLQKYSKHNGQFLWELFICSFEKPGQLLWKLFWSTVSHKRIILFFILGNDVMILNICIFNYNLKHNAQHMKIRLRFIRYFVRFHAKSLSKHNKICLNHRKYHIKGLH